MPNGGTPNRYRELIAGKHDATLLRTPFELLRALLGARIAVAIARVVERDRRAAPG